MHDVNLSTKWNARINYISITANRTLGFLYRNISHASLHTKKLAFTVFICPPLEYAAAVWPVWVPWQPTLKTQLQQIQCRAAQFVTNTLTCNLTGPAGLGITRK